MSVEKSSVIVPLHLSFSTARDRPFLNFYFKTWTVSFCAKRFGEGRSALSDEQHWRKIYDANFQSANVLSELSVGKTRCRLLVDGSKLVVAKSYHPLSISLIFNISWAVCILFAGPHSRYHIHQLNWCSPVRVIFLFFARMSVCLSFCCLSMRTLVPLQRSFDQFLFVFIPFLNCHPCALKWIFMELTIRRSSSGSAL